MAYSKRVRSPASCVISRPESSARMTVCPCSTVYSRTCAVPRRPVAFQSMRRGSSPATYSRNASKLMPPPLRRIWRTPASRNRRCTASNRNRRTCESDGTTSTCAAIDTSRITSISPSAPCTRTATVPSGAGPRRTPRIGVLTVVVPRAGNASACVPTEPPPSDAGMRSASSRWTSRGHAEVSLYSITCSSPEPSCGGAVRVSAIASRDGSRMTSHTAMPRTAAMAAIPTAYVHGDGSGTSQASDASDNHNAIRAVGT